MAERTSTRGNQASTEQGYDLDKVDVNSLPQELRPIYNSMLTDYRKKTTMTAEEKKAWEAEKRQYEQRLNEMNGQLQQHQQYVQRINPYLQQVQQKFEEYERQRTAQPQYSGDDDTMDDYAKFQRELAQRDQQIQQLMQAQKQQEEMINRRTNEFLQLSGMQEQLLRLRQTYPGIDENQVIEIAKGLNPGNLEAAAKFAYYDQAKEAYAKEYADKQLAEERERWQQEQQARQFEPGANGGVPFVFDRPMERPVALGDNETPIPKSWNSARQVALEMLQKRLSEQGS